MKPSLAFIVSVFFLHMVFLLCEARPFKVDNPAVPIPSQAFSPAISEVSTANVIETASYKDEYAESLKSGNKKYAGYQKNEDDGSGAPPRMSHQQGHSPGVGHSYPYSLCC
ncbi:hypothetical protein SUGI_0699300 [Cryptomeria japonica]|nr:hypothetical protein SUGI_0699300 [Cryptomeria japonica]